MKNAVVLATYSRTNLLQESIESVINAACRSEIHFVVVLQKGNYQTEEIVRSFEKHIDTLIIVDGKNKSPIENINYNRIIAYNYCFDNLNSEWVLGIEDDTCISPDAIRFATQMMNEFRNQSRFRGVNLGSKIAVASEQGYSKFRYGVMGQGSVISCSTWRRIKKSRRFALLQTEPLDAIMEHYIKTGFTVIPNRSRIIDRGWDGTHMRSHPNDPHFDLMRKSWLSSIPNVNIYTYQQMDPNWRADQQIYRRRNDLWFEVVRFLIGFECVAKRIGGNGK